MRNIKLTLEYNGTHFFGFQRQKHHRTVQSELESALQKLFQKKLKVIASGRTDSGVHAEAQVVNFHVRSNLAITKIQQGLNHYLPADVAVLKTEEVPSSFHAQYSARRKVYEYRVSNSKIRSPLERFRTYQVPDRLDLTGIKRAARLFLGTHNFRAFESSRGRRKSAVRTIRKFQIRKKGKMIYFTIESNGFLYKMVRSMVGTLLEIGRGRLQISDLKNLLISGGRSRVGPTCPAKGLTLKAVIY